MSLALLRGFFYLGATGRNILTNDRASAKTGSIKTPENNYIPCDITPIDMTLLGKMQDCQRKMYMLIVGRSSLGLFTTYDCALLNGVGAPAKRIQELLTIEGTDLHFRRDSRIVAWCV